MALFESELLSIDFSTEGDNADQLDISDVRVVFDINWNKLQNSIFAYIKN